ncbi:Choline-sulfatase [Planctomycetes bacterium Pan216]|uniref:Choline-sulfatase n=1 Tax=Kolteria novifilia TaxID=2527975 RepID=A0A518B4J1_9BACT|nr:Choline-sulfatase [Planctomycetes bacterium Pan216]
MRTLHPASWLIACLSTLLVVPAPSSRAGEPEWNVLFVAADDLGNVLGKSRPEGLRTPNLDRLAKRGTFFERAYCQIPLCNPSRASVMTGLRPDATTVYDLDRHFRDQLRDAVTLPQLFRQHGWFAARVGKIYHYDVPRGIGTNGLDDKPSWDLVVNPKGRDVTEEAKITNPTPHKPVSAAMSWLAAGGSDDEQTDGMIATEAIRLLENLADRPFFLGVGFFRPHTPYVAPKKYFNMYPLESIRLPDIPSDDRDDIPQAAIPHNIPKPNYGLPDEDLRKSLQAYYASVSFLDAQIGRVLDAVDRLGLRERTIVVFWSDHGYHLGEHGLWQKRTLFDESARSPLIIDWPAAKSHGVPCQRVVEFVDIYPTVVDLVGLSIPEDLDGRSLRPLLEDPERTWDGVAFTQILRPGKQKPIMGRAVTTDRWRYAEWEEGRQGRELYDHETDPRELTNLADAPEHQNKTKRLRRLFSEKARGNNPETPVIRSRL